MIYVVEVSFAVEADSPREAYNRCCERMGQTKQWELRTIFDEDGEDCEVK